MNFKNDYPEFASIERQIRQARVERAAMVGTLLARGALAIGAAFRQLGGALTRGLEAERDRRAVEADSFLRRSVPKY